MGHGGGLRRDGGVCAHRSGRAAAAWRQRRMHGHTDPDVVRAFASIVPLRCPHSLIKSGVRRLGGLRTPEGVAALRDGEAFVCPADDLIGGRTSPLRSWDFGYLQRHLPRDMKFPVNVRGTGKILMTHTNRNLTTEEIDALEAEGALPLPDPRFRPVRREMMTMDAFVTASAAHAHARAAGEEAEPPYLGTDMLWRTSMEDNGHIQNIGDVLKKDLVGGANFPALKALMDAGELPLMKQAHLFVGSERTLYHCHYDLQPNLHVQLVGSKRFILFPPEEFERLHPFPVYHDFDRRSQVDLDHLDSVAFPNCHDAKGQVVELQPGELLYLPVYVPVASPTPAHVVCE